MSSEGKDKGAQATTLAAEHLFRLRLELSRRTVLHDGPEVTRVLCRIMGGTAEGARLTATVLPGGSDWVTVRATGVSHLDVRMMLDAGDGALILMEYQGIYEGPSGRGPRVAPTFQSSEVRYTWLNNIQAVGLGTPAVDGVTYEIYGLC